MDERAAAADEPAGFSNRPIGADDLPQLHEERFEPLDPAYARVRTLTALVVALVIAVVAIVATIAVASAGPLVAGVAAITTVVIVGVVHRLETDRMGYLVREHDVSFASGVIGRSVATAPFARVQHVSIDRGPIDRRFGLAALQLRTAGGHISIPGLRHDVAERLKQLVTDRAGALADAEIPDDEPADAATAAGEIDERARIEARDAADDAA